MTLLQNDILISLAILKGPQSSKLIINTHRQTTLHQYKQTTSTH